MSALVEAFFATYSQEREKWKAKSEMVKLYAHNYCWTKRVDVWISKCVVVGTLTCKCVEGKKNQVGDDIATHWCTYFLLFERLKNN